MDQELNYYDLGGLIFKCVNGDIDMHEPLEVSNKLRNKRYEISVLQHILVLCKSENRSLINILSMIRSKIKHHLLEMISDNSFIRNYIQSIIHEWTEDISAVDIFEDNLTENDPNDDIFDYGKLTNEASQFRIVGGGLESLESELNDKQLSFKPLSEDYTTEVTDKVRDLHHNCYNCMERVKTDMGEAQKKLEGVSPIHLSILLDLSTKCKSMYLESSNSVTEEDSSVFSNFLAKKGDLEIPDNIHTIFLNYCITINMIQKEMKYIKHSYNGLLEGIEPKTKVMTKFMDGLNLFDLMESNTEQSNLTQSNAEPSKNNLSENGSIYLDILEGIKKISSN